MTLPGKGTEAFDNTLPYFRKFLYRNISFIDPFTDNAIPASHNIQSTAKKSHKSDTVVFKVLGFFQMLKPVIHDIVSVNNE